MNLNEMKIKKITFLSLIAFILILPGCKKYEGGPIIPLKSKLILGFWESVNFFIDNEEQSGDGSIFYDFKDDGSYYRVFELGKWEFDQKKEKLIMTPDFSSNAYEMTILRLTNQELWLELEISSKIYEYHFEKNDQE